MSCSSDHGIYTPRLLPRRDSHLLDMLSSHSQDRVLNVFITDPGPVTSTMSTRVASLAIGHARLQNLDKLWTLTLSKSTGTGQDLALIYNRIIEWVRIYPVYSYEAPYSPGCLIHHIVCDHAILLVNRISLTASCMWPT